MRTSRIDRLLAEDGWKGALTRVLVVTGSYFGIKYLPQIIAWASIHWGWRPASEEQLRNHAALVTVSTWAICISLCIEFVRVMVGFIRRLAMR